MFVSTFSVVDGVTYSGQAVDRCILEENLRSSGVAIATIDKYQYTAG